MGRKQGPVSTEPEEVALPWHGSGSHIPWVPQKRGLPGGSFQAPGYMRHCTKPRPGAPGGLLSMHLRTKHSTWHPVGAP